MAKIKKSPDLVPTVIDAVNPNTPYPQKPSWRVLIMENLGEVTGLLTGILILICATIAVTTGNLNHEVYSLVLSVELAGGFGFAAGKNSKRVQE